MTKPTQTDMILTAMLTEKTGRSFLDSGDAYGRHWERNQGLTVEALLAVPAVSVGRYGVELDLFHWLRDRLTYDAELDRKLELWNALYFSDSPWLEVMDTFASKLCTGEVDNYSWQEGYCAGDYNSYSHDNLLSQTIQFVMFEDPQGGEPIVLLQIHGGADVRGGYTAPRAFRVDGGEASDMLDFDGFSVWHHHEETGTPFPGMPEPDMHAYDHRNGEWVSYGGSFVKDPWNGEDMVTENEDGTVSILCPDCTDPTPMKVDKYPI